MADDQLYPLLPTFDSAPSVMPRWPGAEKADKKEGDVPQNDALAHIKAPGNKTSVSLGKRPA